MIYSSLNIPCSLGLYLVKLFNIPSIAPCNSLRNIHKNSYVILKLHVYFSGFPIMPSALGKLKLLYLL